MAESLTKVSQNPLELLHQRLRDRAESPLDPAEQKRMVEALIQGGHDIATAARRLYEAKRSSGELVKGTHLKRYVSRDEEKDVLKWSGIFGDKVIRAKFCLNPEDELNWFWIEILPQIDNIEAIMSDENDAEAFPACGVCGWITKYYDAYHATSLLSVPVIGREAPQDLEEFEERRAIQTGFVEILEGCI